MSFTVYPAIDVRAGKVVRLRQGDYADETRYGDDPLAFAARYAADPASVDAAWAEFFRALPLGTWLDFVDRAGNVQAGKLAWVSPISGKRMFVNRRGTRFCVAMPEQLAAMVRLERLRLHRDDDAFYSAMQTAVDSLETTARAA